MKRKYLSMKLLWRLYPEWENHFFDTDEGDDVKDFLEFVESHISTKKKPKK